MEEKTILLVDPEEVEFFDLQRYFSGYHITRCRHPHHALMKLKNTCYDILVADYRMPAISGLDVFIEAQKTHSYRYGILMASPPDTILLERALKRDVIQKVVEKPVTLRQFKQIIDEAMRECCPAIPLIRETKEIMAAYTPPEQMLWLAFPSIIGLDKGLRAIFQQIRIVAAHTVNILLTGETGTGKEVIARLIHEFSRRKEKSFVKVNCSAIPDDLLESELFGYTKGAFTGASGDKPGKIEAAHKGTLFLDEIGDMKVDLQSKLLRVLQEKELERLGSNIPIHVDFRLITATNKDLKKQVSAKCFREDLFYRINTLPIHLPPLRERLIDIPELVQHFLEKTCDEFELKKPFITEAALKCLSEHQWPGNVRELENAVKRAVLVSGGQDYIERCVFDFLLSDDNEQPWDFDRAVNAMRDAIIQQRLNVKHIEKHVLNSIVEYYDGNIARAVEQTGISKDRFYRSQKAFTNATSLPNTF